VTGGIDFLIKHGLGHNIKPGHNVAVIGGGNTAMDCARTVWRMGAENVYLLYRRSRKEMPANDIEVEEAEAEGISYKFLSAPTKVTGKNGKLNTLLYQKMKLGPPDASGRSRPVPIEGAIESIKVDNILSAIGQIPDLYCLDTGIGAGIERSKFNSILVTPGTCQTNLSGYFAGGDAARGAATAVEAIRDGRFAARAINLQLLGQNIEPPTDFHATAPVLKGTEDGFESRPVPEPRVQMPCLSIDDRRQNFTEVETGLTQTDAQKEAERCLECGLVCYK
jgi:NADPH-dependent glutamate synthase beta subunit-like oxidoreductase